MARGGEKGEEMFCSDVNGEKKENQWPEPKQKVEQGIILYDK